MVTFINRVAINDYNDLDKDKHGFRAESKVLECQNGDNTTTNIISNPYNISMVAGRIKQTGIVAGDSITVYGQPKSNPAGKIGTLTSDKDAETTVIPITWMTEIPEANRPYLLWQGIYIRFEGSDTTDYLITAYDADNNLITITPGLDTAKTSGTNIIYRKYSMMNFKLEGGKDYEFGTYYQGSELLKTNSQMVLQYNHSAQLTADKYINWELYYFYGELQS